MVKKMLCVEVKVRLVAKFVHQVMSVCGRFMSSVECV
jgi:hypothetical protein